MIIGVPSELKKEERRVGLIPDGVAELVRLGHKVLVEKGAGLGSGFSDGLYIGAGAEMTDGREIFRRAGLIVKVKEPLPPEYGFLRPGQTIFTFLHLASNPALTGALLGSGVSALAYETLEDGGGLPLLAPMSEIAGRMAPLMGAFYLQAGRGGSGVFAAGAVGVGPCRCLILGAGNAGTNAARVSYALGMDTTVVNITTERLRRIDEMFRGRVKTLLLTEAALGAAVRDADIVIGAALVPGAKAPLLITRPMLGTMRRGSVLVDISIDQGGVTETSRPTTHDDPVYEVDGIIHYCVANMPAAYPRTSTLALANATLPYVKLLAETGVEAGVEKSGPLRSALNIYRGRVVHPGVARSLGVESADINGPVSTERPL
ncbi:MAG: alanine dehydrogenase [Nitrospiraceae bacterium]|nr:alanine dehydrogenase [Nitrospiraceae bacterium]